MLRKWGGKRHFVFPCICFQESGRVFRIPKPRATYMIRWWHGLMGQGRRGNASLHNLVFVMCKYKLFNCEFSCLKKINIEIWNKFFKEYRKSCSKPCAIGHSQTLFLRSLCSCKCAQVSHRRIFQHQWCSMLLSSSLLKHYQFPTHIHKIKTSKKKLYKLTQNENKMPTP